MRVSKLVQIAVEFCITMDSIKWDWPRFEDYQQRPIEPLWSSYVKSA